MSTRTLLACIALGGAIAAAVLGSPSAQAGPVTCEQFYRDYDCHWTDNEGNRHKTTEYCWNDGRCTIREVY